MRKKHVPKVPFCCYGICPQCPPIPTIYFVALHKEHPISLLILENRNTADQCVAKDLRELISYRKSQWVNERPTERREGPDPVIAGLSWWTGSPKLRGHLRETATGR